MGKEILQQGAEAVIIRNDNEVIKKRIEKSYRIKILDEKIRKLRTRSEGKIMEKAEKIIPVPKVIKIDEKNKELVLEFINGERISDCLNKFPIKKQEEICERIGENIAKLHSNDIIHGDLTPSNMILFEDKEKRESKVYFIDFGLGFISSKAEDKAVDLHLLREAIEAGFSKNWETLFHSIKIGYSKDYKDSEKVLERFKVVEKRGRYKQGS